MRVITRGRPAAAGADQELVECPLLPNPPRDVPDELELCELDEELDEPDRVPEEV